jgi:hypothetical protein
MSKTSKTRTWNMNEREGYGEEGDCDLHGKEREGRCEVSEQFLICTGSDINNVIDLT